MKVKQEPEFLLFGNEPKAFEAFRGLDTPKIIGALKPTRYLQMIGRQTT